MTATEKTSTATQKAIDLLLKIKAIGVRMTLDNGSLSLKVPKGTSLSIDLMNELKDNRQVLIEYLKSDDLMQSSTTHAALPHIIHDDERYYPVSSVERYWIDEEIDSAYKKADKTHGPVGKRMEVLGSFDKETFVKAVTYVIQRHESLRSTFHKINGQFFMRVNNVPLPQSIEVIDARDQAHDNEFIEHYMAFHGHKFEMALGPIFMARLIQTRDDKFLISVRAHHVVMDTWSWEVLIRDFFLAYEMFVRGQIPQLPPLKYQLKDYMAMANHHRQMYFERDKQHWAKRFPTLPTEAHWPGASKITTALTEKIIKTTQEIFPNDLCERLNAIAGSSSTSLFIVLQAAFNSFFYRKTGCGDIIVGTYVHGRNKPETENHIACLASCALIRTVLHYDDSFLEIIKKVKDANDEMKTHTACTLEEYLEGMSQQGTPVRGGLWKVNLQYIDAYNGYQQQNLLQQDSLNMKINLLEIADTSITPIDMHWQFVKYKTHLEVVVEFDSSLYDASIVKSYIIEFFDHTNSLI